MRGTDQRQAGQGLKIIETVQAQAASLISDPRPYEII